MWRLTVVTFLVFGAYFARAATISATPKNGDELVSSVLANCVEMDCVKQNVLGYLDNVLKVNGAGESRSIKNIDATIFKRAAKVLKTHEFRVKLPEMFFDRTEIVYNPKSGLDVASTGSESRGLLLKKKLLLPFLLLLKLKMKLLMPILLALTSLKALKALILSKLAIVIVIGFIAYQLLGKPGMPMMMNPAPAEPPNSMYGPPEAGPSTAPPSSYDPSSWEPSSPGGPYSRVWSSSSNSNNKDNGAQNLAYSAYYPGPDSSSTSRP